jgi:hypothetical protein
MKFHITSNLPPEAGTTCGFWRWDQSRNKGTLHIYCVPLSKRRYRWAVLGHEIIEAVYCKLFRVTTEEADRWDIAFERSYEVGEFPYSFEAGDHPDCPYFFGHRLGVAWEYFCVYCTFADWADYERDCCAAMGIEPGK